MHRALGIHVFGGGFGLGVRDKHKIEAHLETHNFGIETAEQNLGVPIINCSACDWPSIDADWVYGNPRCTAFSLLTSGCSESAHGPFAKQTIDIQELCQYGVKNDYPVICWESVQQAYSIGRPLLDYLRDNLFAPNGYRIAHLFINAASFGNAQNRKRYFFVAYKRGKNFNISPPELPDFFSGPYHKIYDLIDNETREDDGTGWTPDTYKKLHDSEKECLQYLQNGFSLNKLAKMCYKHLSEDHQYIWKTRASDVPFGLHAIRRISWMSHCPTLTGKCSALIHPRHHRPLTLRELSRLMGWGDYYPIGVDPAAQLGKGICPEIGSWLADQVTDYLNDEWGSEDWESSFDHREGEWKGGDVNGALEKVFNLTSYKPYSMDDCPFDNPIEHLWYYDRLTGERYYSEKQLRKIQREYA